MFMPNLIPRDIHHIWLQTESSSNKRSSSSSSSSHPTSIQNQLNQNSHTNYQSQQRTSLLYNNAPPLSSYSSERPGAIVHSSLSSINDYDYNPNSSCNFYSNTAEVVTTDMELRLRQLRSIRTLGFSYLAPLGIGKTMETLEEERMIKMQMNEQYQSEASTAENLFGEAVNTGNHNNTENSGVATSRNNVNTETETTSTQTQIGNHQSTQEQPQTETQETEVDLDDFISDAESYTNIYEIDDDNDLIVNDGETFESQYDRGFMVREQDEDEDQESPSGSSLYSSSSNNHHNISYPTNTPHRINRGLNHGDTTTSVHHVEFVIPSRNAPRNDDHHFSGNSSFGHLSSSNSNSSFCYVSSTDRTGVQSQRIQELPIREEDEITSNDEGEENEDHDMTFDE